MGLREIILLVLLVRPTNRCLDVGDRDTLTALLSRLKKLIFKFLTAKILLTFQGYSSLSLAESNKFYTYMLHNSLQGFLFSSYIAQQL